MILPTAAGTMHQMPRAVATLSRNGVVVRPMAPMSARISTLTIAKSTLLSNDTDPDSSDTLSITSVGGITGTSADGATVTLSGNNIIYDPTHSATLQALGAGQTATDTFSYTISDGHGGTSTATVSLVVSGINDAPVFTGNDLAQTYHIGDGPVSIVGNVAAGDIDSANYNGGWLTATVIAGSHSGDTLSIVHDDFISLDGNAVMFDYDGALGSGAAVEIGTLTDGINSLRIDLNGNATDGAVAKLAQAIEFQNTLSNADPGARTVAFTLHDGGGTDNSGQDSDYFTADVTVAASSASNHAPVISTDQFTVTENHDADGSVTVSGLYVSDADTSDTFTLSATTGAAPVSTVDAVLGRAGGEPVGRQHDAAATASSTIPVRGSRVNRRPTRSSSPSPTALGASDTVNFIFNQGNDNGDVTLTGTSGKDVIFTTGNNDILTGGAGADQFVFKVSSNTNSDTITDFTPGQDHIDLRAFSSINRSTNHRHLALGSVRRSQTNSRGRRGHARRPRHRYPPGCHPRQPACRRLHRSPHDLAPRWPILAIRIDFLTPTSPSGLSDAAG